MKTTPPPLRLQKLCYYCQVWSLVWDRKPLFKGVIEAWVNGPVVPSLHTEKDGEFVLVDMTKANPNKLGGLEQETIDAVLDFCKDRDTEWLVELSKKEKPWKDARASLKDADSNPVIMHKALYDYYSNIE